MFKSYNRLSSIESLTSARNARRRAYQRAALAELSSRVSSDLAQAALDLALAEIWQDHADELWIDGSR